MALSEQQTSLPSEFDLPSQFEKFLDILRSWRSSHVRLQDNAPSLHYSIWRYEMLWLPLVSKHQKKAVPATLLPPADIHYIWLMHILIPQTYSNYCYRRFDRTLYHTFHESTDDESDLLTQTQQLWREMYPNEPFYVEEIVNKSHASSVSADILESIVHNRQLLDHLYLPHIHDGYFVASAIDRYCKFMQLMRTHRDQFLQPTTDIHAVWWVHRANNAWYEHDITAIFGADNSVEQNYERLYDVTGGGDDVIVGDDDVMTWTEMLWYAAYGDTYQASGTQYVRVPGDILGSLDTSVVKPSSEPSGCVIGIDRLCVDEVWTRQRDLRIEVRRLGHSAVNYQIMCQVKGQVGHPIPIKQTISAGGKTYFDFGNHRGIEFDIYGTSGKWCFAKESHVASMLFTPRDSSDEKNTRKPILKQMEIPRIYRHDPRVTFFCRLEMTSEEYPKEFTLFREPFADAPLPTDHQKFISDLWSWKDLKLSSSVQFMTATHSVNQRQGELNLSCRIMCAKEEPLTVITTHHQVAGLTTIAHSIGNDLLPESSQVQSETTPFCLDSWAGDVAMVIRNSGGIWGVCVATRDQETGTAHIAFWNADDDAIHTCRVDYLEKSYQIADVAVCLQTGDISLSPGCSQVAEYLTLAFCIGNMYVQLSGHDETHLKRVDRQVSSLSSATRYRKNKIEKFNSFSTKSTVSKYSVNGKVTQTTGQSPMGSRTATVATRQAARAKKRQSMFCTMLLACGLRVTPTNPSINLDSVRSSDSLIPRKTQDGTFNDQRSQKTEKMNMIKAATAATAVRKFSRPLEAKKQTAVLTGYENAAFSSDTEPRKTSIGCKDGNSANKSANEPQKQLADELAMRLSVIVSPQTDEQETDSGVQSPGLSPDGDSKSEAPVEGEQNTNPPAKVMEETPSTNDATTPQSEQKRERKKSKKISVGSSGKTERSISVWTREVMKDFDDILMTYEIGSEDDSDEEGNQEPHPPVAVNQEQTQTPRDSDVADHQSTDGTTGNPQMAVSQQLTAPSTGEQGTTKAMPDAASQGLLEELTARFPYMSQFSDTSMDGHHGFTHELELGRDIILESNRRDSDVSKPETKSADKNEPHAIHSNSQAGDFSSSNDSLMTDNSNSSSPTHDSSKPHEPSTSRVGHLSETACGNEQEKAENNTNILHNKHMDDATKSDSESGIFETEDEDVNIRL